MKCEPCSIKIFLLWEAKGKKSSVLYQKIARCNKTHLQTHFLSIKESKTPALCSRLSSHPLRSNFPSMWHEFGRLRQWPPSFSCDPHRQLWKQSSKALPAVHINHTQLAQRGNSICRRLHRRPFIRGRLIIRARAQAKLKEWGKSAGGSTTAFA